MWKATLSKCTDGEVWIVKTPWHTWEYKAFETEAEAQAYADETNVKEERAEDATEVATEEATVVDEAGPIAAE